jgi:hypothetical protein
VVDISIVEKNSIKIKSKRVTFVVDPTKEMSKTPADAVIFLNGGSKMDVSKVADFRMIIDGPGEYEVGGVKISSTKISKGIVYRLSIDGMTAVLGVATDTKMEGFNACEVMIANTTNDFSESFVTALEPRIVVLYGDKGAESAKKLGVENIAAVSKITITKDKLPEKMEAVVLG